MHMIVSSMAFILGYWNQFNDMSEVTNQEQAQRISRLENDLSRLEGDLALASKEKRKGADELVAAQRDIENLRERAVDLRASGYDLFQGRLRKALPQLDPATNWTVDFSGLLAWVRWVASEEQANTEERTPASPDHAEEDNLVRTSATEVPNAAPVDGEEGQAGSSPGSSSLEEDAP